MQLYKRGRVYWIRGWYSGGKLRESTHCTDQRAADLYRRRRERELADPAHAAAHAATVHSARERFERELKHEEIADGTRHMYEVKGGHLSRLLGTVRLSELDHETVLGYVHTREAEGAASHTVHKELTTLRRLLASAARAKEFTGDPRAIMPRYSTGYKPTEQWVDAKHLWKVIRSMEPGRGAWLAFVVSTGANVGDVERARRGDITRTSIRVRGTKTNSRDRTIPILSLFEPFVAFVRKHADGEGDALFRPWANVRRDIALACEACEVPTFNATQLRHTTATWLVRAGVPFELVAKILGHASTAMLQRVYGHLDALDVGALIEKRLEGAQRGHTRRRGTGRASKSG